MLERNVAPSARLLAAAVAAVFAGFSAGPALADAPRACPRQPQPQIASCSMTITGNQALGTLEARATFRIAPGHANVQVSLAAYRKRPPRFAVTFPQQLYASVTGFFDVGDPHVLRVPLPSPCGFYQVDLAIGPVIGPTISNAESGYRADRRLLEAATGGFKCPYTLGYWKNHASCSTSAGSRNHHLDAVIASASGGAGFRVGNLLLTTQDPAYCINAVRVLDKRTISGVSNTTAAFQLAAQLLAARLNLFNGGVSCPKINHALVSSQKLLTAIKFTGAGTPAMTSGQRTLALDLADLLDTHNNGYTTENGLKLRACV